ncbi:hypothetical protein PY32053_00759 [Paracoccus yeei]|uniref:Helix-turn-helix domain-containing protein n=1 Tax=Paracoccus yeei TaxID=147645 RepID=A0A386UIB2_9RHOB|nr:hypothetical protein [Paracoccus yeei]AYF00434.1 hypothetical protein PY32053_00759 [Paracoccus yeei]AZV00440.1 replication initiation protein [Paracoccus phage vB_PyeM_Pyei1]
MRQRSRRQGRAYAAIPNAAMRDERISIEARGLLALLMTYADDWTFVVDHLQQVAGCGRDKMRGMLKELEAAGYVIRQVLRGEGGHLAGTEWMIVDDPAAAAHGVVSDVETQDAGEQGKNGSVHRPPENPSIGATDPLKNRPPVEPTAGKSVPIRKPKDKNTNLKKSPNPLPGSGDDGWADYFDRFWEAFPDPVERDAARKAFDGVLEAGEIGPEDLIEVATAYARSRHVERGYGMKPANWLARGSWRDEWEASKAAKAAAPPTVDMDAVAQRWVEPVKAGRTYAASSIKPAVARHMLSLGLVTETELRRAGVTL